MVVAEVEAVVVVRAVKEDRKAVLDRMILWRAIAVGCVAIWPATVPRKRSHREVAWLALPVENPLNPCNEAHEVEEEEDDRSGSVASVSCTMTRVTNTPSTMQDNCMCRSNMDRLLSVERLRWK